MEDYDDEPTRLFETSAGSELRQRVFTPDCLADTEPALLNAACDFLRQNGHGLRIEVVPPSPNEEMRQLLDIPLAFVPLQDTIEVLQILFAYIEGPIVLDKIKSHDHRNAFKRFAWRRSVLIDATQPDTQLTVNPILVKRILNANQLTGNAIFRVLGAILEQERYDFNGIRFFSAETITLAQALSEQLVDPKGRYRVKKHTVRHMEAARAVAMSAIYDIVFYVPAA